MNITDECRPLVGNILRYLANKIEEDKRGKLNSKGGIIMDEHYWLGRETAHEDAARFMENEFSLSRREFYP